MSRQAWNGVGGTPDHLSCQLLVPRPILSLSHTKHLPVISSGLQKGQDESRGSQPILHLGRQGLESSSPLNSVAHCCCPVTRTIGSNPIREGLRHSGPTLYPELHPSPISSFCYKNKFKLSPQGMDTDWSSWAEKRVSKLSHETLIGKNPKRLRNWGVYGGGHLRT